MRNFKHTMDLLIKAYLSNSLEHSKCAACAVGNICGGDTIWSLLFITLTSDFSHKQWMVHADNSVIMKSLFDNNATEIYDPIRARNAREVVAKTGYSVQELARIEYAFETAPKGQSDDDWMFNGLVAVLDVLADIHQVDFNEKQLYKDQLVEAFQD